MGIKRRVNAICALVISPRLYSTDFRMPLPHTKPTGPPAAPALGEHLAFEQILVRQAGRLAAMDTVSREDLMRLTAEDVRAADPQAETEQPRT